MGAGHPRESKSQMTTLEIAALVATYALAVTRLLKPTQPLWSRLPRWAQLVLPALLVSLPQLAGALGLVETQLELVEAIFQAIVAVAIAAGGQTGSAAKTAALLLFLSFGASACAAAKPYIATINQAAGLLCESSPVVLEQAKARGVSVAELCAIRDVLDPFITEAMRAQQRAGRSARFAPVQR